MKESIDLNNLPAHIAVIMDGNGRWAKQKGFTDRIFGHRNAIQAVRETIAEVSALMALLVSTIQDELPTMMKNQVRLNAIGDLSTLPGKSASELQTAIDKTANNTGLTLVLALSYSGKWDVVNAE